jgi:hypothetical protein
MYGRFIAILKLMPVLVPVGIDSGGIQAANYPAINYFGIQDFAV